MSDFIFSGAEAKAVGKMRFRASAPTNTMLWYEKGAEIGLLSAGEAIQIQEVKAYPSLLGEQLWVKVERLDPNANPKSGWACYGGKTT